MQSHTETPNPRDAGPVLDAAQDSLIRLSNRNRLADCMTFRAAAPGYLMVALDAETMVVMLGLTLIGLACGAFAVVMLVVTHLVLA